MSASTETTSEIESWEKVDLDEVTADQGTKESCTCLCLCEDDA